MVRVCNRTLATAVILLTASLDVINGDDREFEAFVRTDVVPALKKGGAPWFERRIVRYQTDLSSTSER